MLTILLSTGVDPPPRVSVQKKNDTVVAALRDEARAVFAQMKKTTKDIRGFFEKMKTSQTEEEVKNTTADVPSSFKSLLKLAEGRGKPTTPNNTTTV